MANSNGQEYIDYCEMCEREKETGYEWNGDYICLECYSGLYDRAEMNYESQREEGKRKEDYE